MRLSVVCHSTLRCPPSAPALHCGRAGLDARPCPPPPPPAVASACACNRAEAVGVRERPLTRLCTRCPRVGRVMADRSRYFGRCATVALALSMVVQAVTPAGAQSTSVRQTRDFQWEVKNDTITALGCLFLAYQDLFYLPINVEDCPGACKKQPECSHFDWSSVQRRCQLKSGPVTQDDARPSPNTGAICGMVSSRRQGSGKASGKDGDKGGGNSDWVGRALALVGGLAGGALAAAAVAGLFVRRARRKRSAAAAGHWREEERGAEPGAGTATLPPPGAGSQGHDKVVTTRTVATTAASTGTATALTARPTHGTVGGAAGMTAVMSAQGGPAAAGGTGYPVSSAPALAGWGPPLPPPRVAPATSTGDRPGQLVVLGAQAGPPSELWMTEDIQEWYARHGGVSVPPMPRPAGP